MIVTKDNTGELARMLYERRKELGLTQRKVAEQAHYNLSGVCRVEYGTMVPHLDVLCSICEALNLEIEIRSCE